MKDQLCVMYVHIHTSDTHYSTHRRPTLCMCVCSMGFSNSNVCVHLTVCMYVYNYIYIYIYIYNYTHTVEHSYNKPETLGQTVCYKQVFLYQNNFS